MARLAQVELSGIKMSEENEDATLGNDEDGPEEFYVERILKKQFQRGIGILYLVKWKDYPESENTWEPEKNLAKCQEAIREFEQQEEEKRHLGSTRRRTPAVAIPPPALPKKRSSSQQAAGKRQVRKRAIIQDSSSEDNERAEASGSGSAGAVASLNPHREVEESDAGYDYSAEVIDVIYPDPGEDGFERGWKVDVLQGLMLLSDTPVQCNEGCEQCEQEEKQPYVLVKFRGYKRTQVIRMKKVNEHEPKMLFEFLRAKLAAADWKNDFGC